VRAYVHYGHTLDAVDWEVRHGQGLVPDRLPYGLDRMADFGVEVRVRPSPRVSRLARLAARGLRWTTRGLEWPDLLRDHTLRRGADVVCCWDERAGTLAALRSRLPGEPPVATGVVWLTDLDLGRSLRTHGAVRALQAAAAVYVNAPAQLDVLRSWGFPGERLHFIPMGVDADFWRTQGRPRTAGLVLGVGNDRHRDHELLIEGIRRLWARRGDVRLELVTHHRVNVPAVLGDRRSFCDHVALRELYGRASVVALALKPNVHLSGLTVLLEAMACRVPVVATETPGMREYVRDGETGLLVPRDPDAIAEAVGRLLQDPDRAREMGEAGRRAVEAAFTTGHLARGLVQVLRAVAR